MLPGQQSLNPTNSSEKELPNTKRYALHGQTLVITLCQPPIVILPYAFFSGSNILRGQNNLCGYSKTKDQLVIFARGRLHLTPNISSALDKSLEFNGR